MDTSKKPAVKILFILIDGIGELDIDKLGNKTPLQHGDLPYINTLANTGTLPESASLNLNHRLERSHGSSRNRFIIVETVLINEIRTRLWQ